MPSVQCLVINLTIYFKKLKDNFIEFTQVVAAIVAAQVHFTFIPILIQINILCVIKLSAVLAHACGMYK